ncbi:hypothetical protein FHG87_023581 [Trinorchestia longiramus]|nr:hypothetical protein FHG87_023581 [Trinorchestia longiramus]
MTSNAKKKLNLAHIEDVLNNESKTNDELEGSYRPVLRETSARLNRPLEMSSLLQKLPDEEALELDIPQGGCSDAPRWMQLLLLLLLFA